MKRHISKILAVILLFCTLISFSGCSLKASYYTEEEHIQRITERIENQRERWSYMYPEGETYEDFKVYPLYNENDELKYCIAEFDPYGFFFISIRDELYLFELIWNKSWYRCSSGYGYNEQWSPYIKDKTKSQPYPDEDKIWILDENGDRVYYDKSPYYVTGDINVKKYLIDIDDGGQYICAVKNNGKYINLISGKEFDLSNLDEQSTIYIQIIKVNDL